MFVTVRELRNLISEGLVQERQGDIEFSREANRICDDILAKIKKRGSAVLKPNVDDDYMSRWDGVHVTLEDLGVDVPDILKDTIITFTWGEDVPSGFFEPPSENHPQAVIGVSYGGPLPRGIKIDQANKRQWDLLHKMMGTADLQADDDIIPFVPHMISIKRTTFVHELRHAYDMLVRDDDGVMAQHMHHLTDKTNDDPKLMFTGDDEMNAHIVTAIEDTLDDFRRSSRGRMTQARAKTWAPNATALYDKFMKNISAGVAEYTDEDLLLRRAGPRLASVWEDFVEGLPE